MPIYHESWYSNDSQDYVLSYRTVEMLVNRTVEMLVIIEVCTLVLRARVS